MTRCSKLKCRSSAGRSRPLTSSMVTKRWPLPHPTFTRDRSDGRRWCRLAFVFHVPQEPYRWNTDQLSTTWAATPHSTRYTICPSCKGVALPPCLRLVPSVSLWACHRRIRPGMRRGGTRAGRTLTSLLRSNGLTFKELSNIIHRPHRPRSQHTYPVAHPRYHHCCRLPPFYRPSRYSTVFHKPMS